MTRTGVSRWGSIGLVLAMVATLLAAPISPLDAPARATDFTVCGSCEYQTIGSAIVVAVDGDVINVEAGTYLETIVIDRDLTIQGATGAAATTIVSGAESDGTSVVTVEAGVTATISELTITGGTAQEGGGVYNA